MYNDRKALGALGEKIAVDFLKKRGYKILETNYRCSLGELDIVAEHNSYLVFIEVRTKKNLQFGLPEESITPAKKEKLISLAQNYLQTYTNLPSFWRIDIVAIELKPDNKVSRIEVIENAIS